MDGVLADSRKSYPVLDSREVFRGAVFSMFTERVQYGDSVAARDFVKHPGAVAVVPLRVAEQGQFQVLMINQYRHPVSANLWEIPAGLLDVAGETPLLAAQRELEEEAGLSAQRWDVLVDYFTSPGGSSEALRIFLARDLSEIPVSKRTFLPQDEESFMTCCWVDLSDAVLGVFEGRIHNPSAVVGLLAVNWVLEHQGAELRHPGSFWMR